MLITPSNPCSPVLERPPATPMAASLFCFAMPNTFCTKQTKVSVKWRLIVGVPRFLTITVRKKDEEISRRH